MLKQPPVFPAPTHPPDCHKNQKSPNLCSPWWGRDVAESVLPQRTSTALTWPPPKKCSGGREGWMDSSAAFPHLPGAGDGALGAGWDAPEPSPGAGSAKGPASGTGSCDTQPHLLPQEFSYCSQAAVSAAWALPSSGAVTLTEPDPSLHPRQDGEMWVKCPSRHWAARGCGLGLGCCCKEQELLAGIKAGGMLGMVQLLDRTYKVK